MSVSNRLALPFIDAAQSQKHVTHNEALVELDALVHLSVKARNAAEPPSAPAEGDRYLVGAAATGAFAGKADLVAAFDDGGWAFLTPRAGWRTYVESENLLLLFDGAAWKDLSLSIQALQNLARVGLGTTADASNPLVAKLNSALLTARSSGEGGTGDLRVTLNKSAPANSVSQLYQTNYSGRAETGLTGDDRFHIKVSADGTTWREAVSVDPSTGLVALPQTAGVANGLATLDASGKVPTTQLPTMGGGALAVFRNRLRNPCFAVNQRAVAGTVTRAAGVYGHDGVKAGASGCTYAFAQIGIDVAITILAGSLIMPIEACLIEGGLYRLSHAGTAPARVWQGSGSTGSGAYVAAPFTTIDLAANTQTNVEFSTGTVLRPQLEPGSSETPFERRPYPFELAFCQRYYYRRAATSATDIIATISMYGGTAGEGKLFDLPVEMRVAGTVSFSAVGHFSIWNALFNTAYVVTGTGDWRASPRSVSIYSYIGANGVSSTPGQALVLAFNSTSGWIDVSAEI
jgi:hypothetical protein